MVRTQIQPNVVAEMVKRAASLNPGYFISSSKEGMNRKKITHHVIIYKLQEVPNSQMPERKEGKNGTSISPYGKKSRSDF